MKIIKQPINKSRGFSLIEIMIVVAIIGIIATIALPEYSKYVRESRRTDAISTMNRILSQQELYYANNNSTYTDQVINLGYTENNINGDTITTDSANKYYTIQITFCGTGANDCVLLTATPVVGKTQAQDIECTSFTIDSRGRKTAVNNIAGDTTSQCWKS